MAVETAMALPGQAAGAMTVDEFMALPDEVGRVELVEGRIDVPPPTGHDHQAAMTELCYHLSHWRRSVGAGHVLGGDPAIVVRRDPDTVRCPDIAYWREERQPAPSPGPVNVIPDLVVEIVSPSDRRLAVYAKMQRWLEAGVTVGWIVWPEARAVEVCTAEADPVRLTDGDELTAPELLPGFSVPVTAILPPR